MIGRVLSQSSDAYSRYLSVQRFESLDGFRAVAILAVVWHHTTSAVGGWPMTDRGFLGVDFFFIISGFLITSLLLRESRRTGDISLRKFYIRRILRIFPPYYLTLFVVGAAALLSPGKTSAANLEGIPYAALFLSNLVPMHGVLHITWSLAVEEQFYLLAPSLEKYLRRGIPLFLPLAYLLAILPTFGFLSELTLPLFFRETTFGPILLGMGLAHVLDNPKGFAWASFTLGRSFAPVLALGIGMLAVNVSVGDISGWPRIAIHWAMAALLASCVVSERHVLLPVLTAWPMRRIGMVSYGIYLYHLIVTFFVTKAIAKLDISWMFATFVGTTLATWAVAEISYKYYEKYFLTMKTRFGQ